jgi:hypothetical protein
LPGLLRSAALKGRKKEGSGAGREGRQGRRDGGRGELFV